MCDCKTKALACSARSALLWRFFVHWFASFAVDEGAGDNSSPGSEVKGLGECYIFALLLVKASLTCSSRSMTLTGCYCCSIAWLGGRAWLRCYRKPLCTFTRGLTPSLPNRAAILNIRSISTRRSPINVVLRGTLAPGGQSSMSWRTSTAFIGFRTCQIPLLPQRHRRQQQQQQHQQQPEASKLP